MDGAKTMNQNPYRQKSYHLIWHFDGEMRGKKFADWDECEAFSKRLIKAGLQPKLTENSPCPYDGD
jgi:hypothetical protein